MKSVPLSSSLIRPSVKSTGVPSDFVHVVVGCGLPTAVQCNDTFLRMSTARLWGSLMITPGAVIEIYDTEMWSELI